MLNYSRIYRELDKLKDHGFSLQRTGDISKVTGKNFCIDVVLSDRGIGLEIVVKFDKRHQVDYQIDNDLYDLKKNEEFAKSIIDDIEMILSGIASGSVRYGYISKKPTLLFATTEGDAIAYLKWFFMTKKFISREKAKEYAEQLAPLT